MSGRRPAQPWRFFRLVHVAGYGGTEILEVTEAPSGRLYKNASSYLLTLRLIPLFAVLRGHTLTEGHRVAERDRSLCLLGTSRPRAGGL